MLEAARRDSIPSDSTPQMVSSQRKDLTSPSQYLTGVLPASDENPTADHCNSTASGKGMSPQSTMASSRHQADGLAILLRSPHWKGKVMPGVMIPTDIKKQSQAEDATKAESAAQIVASIKADHKRAVAIEAAARKLKASHVRPPSPPTMTQPFEEGMLGLWSGKRLVSPSL